MLSSLGLGRRKLRGTVLWQAATMTTVALVVGLPAGVFAGRWAWRLFPDQIAVVPLPRLSSGVVVVIALAALVFALVIASAPAQSAARTRPGVVLRTE